MWGWSAPAQPVDGYCRASAGQDQEVLGVGGQDHAAAGSSADGDDRGVDVVGRPSGCCCEEVADASGQGAVGGSDGDPTLAGQACVHGLIVAAAPVELCQDGGGDGDVC